MSGIPDPDIKEGIRKLLKLLGLRKGAKVRGGSRRHAACRGTREPRPDAGQAHSLLRGIARLHKENERLWFDELFTWQNFYKLSFFNKGDFSSVCSW